MLEKRDIIIIKCSCVITLAQYISYISGLVTSSIMEWFMCGSATISWGQCSAEDLVLYYYRQFYTVNEICGFLLLCYNLILSHTFGSAVAQW